MSEMKKNFIYQMLGVFLTVLAFAFGGGVMMADVAVGAHGSDNQLAMTLVRVLTSMDKALQVLL